MVDPSLWWVFLKKNEKQILFVLYSSLLFVIGWQMGRIMSPYYASHPIVFEDRHCAACASSGGSAQELKVLQQQSESQPEIAGTTTSEKGMFVASKSSNLYHHHTCSTASRIKPENQRWFATAEEAKTAGLSPSKCSQDLGY